MVKKYDFPYILYILPQKVKSVKLSVSSINTSYHQN